MLEGEWSREMKSGGDVGEELSRGYRLACKVAKLLVYGSNVLLRPSLIVPSDEKLKEMFAFTFPLLPQPF